MQRMQTFAAAVTLGLALAGCGGAAGVPFSGSALPATPPSTSSTDSVSLARTGPGTTSDVFSIEALNAVGTPLKDLAEENATDQAVPKTTPGTGVCNHRVETFIPDRAGDPNSSEAEVFYDAACTHVARDTVRTYTSTGAGAETVLLTVKTFLPVNGKQLSVRTTTVQLANATFGTNGFPIPADGFTRESTSQLTVGASRKVILGGSEIIVSPASNGTNAFCSDAAAYNSIGIKRLNETFGWSGALSGGVRTANADGSVTWAGTHAGTLFDGAPGSISLVTGTPNTACPIATPAYSLAGGTKVGSASSTISVTFLSGVIKNLTINAATLSGGYTLGVTTNSKAWPASPNYITGVVAHDASNIATFAVNAFGDGTLTLSKRGYTFVIADWNVVR
jgi:hypothetical protein